MSEVKRLTPPQSRKVNALVRRTCCNCDNGNCILLDDGDECVCPQLISYSLLCKWFKVAVLPADKLLYAELYQTGDRKKCTECGTSFASSSNSVKYCPDCRKRITRRQAAERMRKRRAPVTLARLNAERAELANGVKSEHPALVAFTKHQNIDQLSRELLVELINHIKVYENGNISVRFKFADEFRRIAEYIEINTTRPAVAG